MTLESNGDNNDGNDGDDGDDDNDDNNDNDDDSGQYVWVGTVCNWKQSSKQFVFPI